MLELKGIHHLTAVSADIAANHRFYTQVLGMRLVKRSVNQDDVSAYHLFYADAVGTPGTDLTFFDWPMARERRGTHSLTRTSLRVGDGATLAWWAERLAAHGVAAGVAERDGREVLDFEDPEGQRLSSGGRRRGGGASGSLGGESGADRAPATRAGADRDECADARSDGGDADAGAEHAAGREYPHPANARHTVHVYEMGGAARTRSCTWRSSRTCRPAGWARAACTTWRSGRRTARNTTRGRSG
jgi:glyoxalase family protein